MNEVSNLPAGSDVQMQITTARQFPRDVVHCAKSLCDMATLDEDTAAACWYRLERQGKAIEGPSVRLAEMAVSTWGNIRAQARIVEIGQTHVTAEGVCWDLESNAAASVTVKRSIMGKKGRYSEDMIGVTCNAACAVAYRNAVFKIVPGALIQKAYRAAQKYAIGDANELEQRRDKMVSAFSSIGVTLDQVLGKIGKDDVKQVTQDDLSRLIGVFNAIRDGEQTKDQAFGTDQGSQAQDLAASLGGDE